MTKETQADFGLTAGAPAVMECPPQVCGYTVGEVHPACKDKCYDCASRRLCCGRTETPAFAERGSIASTRAPVPVDVTLKFDRETRVVRSGLPTDPQERKRTPIYSGVLKYFPRALAAVARCSFIGNEQHNPGQPLHWAKGKSTDHEDCLLRHMMDDVMGVPLDTDGIPHKVKVAWRALASLETELEKTA